MKILQYRLLSKFRALLEMPISIVTVWLEAGSSSLLVLFLLGQVAVQALLGSMCLRSLALLLNRLRHLLTLSLAAQVRAKPLLAELECPIVLRDLKQLHGAAFIWRKPAHLTNDVSRTNLACFVCVPLRREGRGFCTFFVNLWPFLRPMAMS